MKRIKLITFLALTLNLGVNAQTFEWATNFGGISSDQGQSTAVDASGNVYVTGNFQGTVDFDPGPGNAIHTSNGSRDIFVQKLDASGNFLWATTFGDEWEDYGQSISVDALGNVYTTGYFAGTIDADPGPGTTNLTSVNYDVFIQKLDSDGNLLWATSFGGPENDLGLSLTIDAASNIYTIGAFENTVDFDPGTGTTNLTSNGGQDVFIQKLDASGNLILAKSFGGLLDDVGQSIAVDALENIYSTGYFQFNVDFDPGAGTTNISSNGGQDVFIQKLDGSGDFVFAKSFGTSIAIDNGTSIAVDASENIFTTGSFQSTVDFDPGPGVTSLTSNGQSDIYVQKLNASGDFEWASSFGSTSFDKGTSITVDASGNVYTTGYFQGTADFDPGVGTTNLISNAGWDIFTQKLDASGNLLWVNSVGGSGQDVGSSITLDASGSIYLTGTFQAAFDFDPGPEYNGLSSYGNDNPFILKMGQVVTGSVEITKGVQVKSFPNPSKGLVQLTFEQALNNAEIMITDLNGKVVFTKQVNAVSNEQINIDGAAGIYFLSVNTPQGQSVVKLIKE